jgi:hypothetical protein
MATEKAREQIARGVKKTLAESAPAPETLPGTITNESEGLGFLLSPIVFPILPPSDLGAGNRTLLSTSNGTVATAAAAAAAAVSHPVYWNAGISATVTNYGCSCTMSTFRPKVELGDFTFLSAFVTNDDSSHAEQRIQVGWIRAPSSLLGPPLEADPDLAQLCVFYSVVGSVGAAADFVQGFNDTVQGWVGVPGTFRPGVDVIPASHFNGKQGSIDLKFQLVGDRWNLRMNGTVIGYYPTSLFTVDRRDPANPPLSDPSNTLADHGTRVGFFGQVYDSTGGLTSTDMGSGNFPEEGYGKSAFCYKMQYQPKPTAKDPTMADADSSWTRYVDDPLRYDCLVSWKSNSWWRTFMYLGGPGCEATGWSAWDSVGGFFAPGCPITALSRRPAVIDLFVVGLDGRVYTSWWEDEDWSGFNNDWWLLDWGGQTFLSQTKVAAVARSPDNLDIFVVGTDFKIYTAWWSEGHGWTGWRNISGNQAFGPAPPLVAAVSRHEGQLDVFVASSGVVYTSSWTDSVTDWTGIDQAWDNIGIVSAIPPQLNIVVLSRTPQTMDVITSFSPPLSSGTNFVWNNWTQGSGWATFQSVGTAPGIGTAIRVAGVARTSSRIDLFAMGNDFQVYTSHWTLVGGWSGVPDKWDKLGDPLPAFGPVCDLAAVSRKSSCLDVFVAGVDGRVYTSSFDASAFGLGLWTGWTSIGGQGFGTVTLFGMAACSRNHQTLTVLGCGKGGKVWATEWCDPACGPRPFYCMAHNPNIVNATKDEVDISLKLGANALGPDVNKSSDSGKLVISHGGLLGLSMGSDSDPDLISYLQHLHDLAVSNPQLALVAFDCKPPAHSPDNGHDLLMAIRTHLTHDLPLDIVISVPSLAGVSMFDRIHDILGPREAIAIDEENDANKVAQYFKDIRATSHAVYGNGSTVQDPLLVPNFRHSLELAVGVHAGQDGLQSVYGWTTDEADKQKEFIRIGVDGVMSNLYKTAVFSDPPLQQLVKMVQGDLELRRLVRMATRDDRILAGPTAGYELVVKTGSTGAAGTDADLTFVVRGELGVAKKTVNTSLLGRMESGGTDYIVVQSRDVGDLIDVTVRNDMSRSLLGNSRWRCDSVRVVSARYGVDRTATFGVDVETIPITRPLI